MLHRNAVFLALSGVVSLGCKAQSPPLMPIQLNPIHDVVGWAELPRFQVKINFDSPHTGMKYDLIESQFITTCESSSGLKRQIMPRPGQAPGLPPGTHSLLAFPFNQDETYEAALLGQGAWRCVQTAALAVVDPSGQHSTLRFHSNEARLKVAKPSSADEAVLKESGLWEFYEKGTVERISPLYSITSAVNNHPDSHYYCRFWVEELHKAFDFSKSQRALETKPDDPANEGSFVAWGAKPSKYTEPLDNLEKYKCSEATPADYAFWHADNALNNLSDFAAARSFARKGLALNPDPGQKAYFEKLLGFQSEADFLRQFKHVRRLGPDGQWHE